MSHHDAVHSVFSGHKVTENLELVCFQLVAWTRQGGKFVMGIAGSRGVAREVLAAGEDAGGLQGLVENACHRNDLISAGPVASPPKGVVGLVVEGDVEDRTEVEIEPEDTQKLSSELSMAGNKLKITFVTELAGVGWFVAEELEAGDSASFLVDGDDRLDVAELTETVGESPQLIW